MIGSLVAYSAFFYIVARKIGFVFNPAEFIIFYIVYSPLWLLIIIASIVQVYAGIRNVDLNWKV
ncbi:hypothetical protein J7L00_00440 [Candidatus Bathyarchaeota archaeon]|nr:hypothetical protein [Candidatus Bathyarchaeota archaeon]